jgi:ABC-2 type transport system ATP-binding protein
MSLVITEGLTKHYGRRVGVEGLDLRLPEGVVCGFLGPNGAGKSTTLRLLLGFLRPTAGRASIFGLDCWRQSRRIKADLGYLPDDLRLYPYLTARRALDLFGRMRRRDLRASGSAIAEELLLDLDVKVRSMSRGMRQKLGLVLALAHQPRMLILDEPTTGLDPVIQDRLRRRLQDMALRGHTILFSSHTLGEVERLCERIVILREGKVVADETLAELRAAACREVLVRWKAEGAAATPAPPCLKVLQRRGTVWQCQLVGPVDELVRWLQGRPLEDLVIGRPDMESLFRRHYEGGGDEPRAG